MIVLITRTWNFIKSDFNLIQYTLIIAFVAILIITNYSVLSLETGLINDLPAGISRTMGYILLYSFAYYVAIAITAMSKNRISIFKQSNFWMLSIAGIAIFSMDSGWWLPQLFLSSVKVSSNSYSFYHSLISNGKGMLTISALLLLINFFALKNKQENLGLNKEGYLEPFFIILGVIAPVIVISALDSGLGSYYPTFKYYRVADVWGSPKWVPPLIYEIIYGADFFTVELFFRGFFVIGISTALGKEAIIPMAVFYCTIHFGKPLVECISSLFGGYFLGIIAYETRNIWGGVVLHIGVAWTMEFASTIGK